MALLPDITDKLPQWVYAIYYVLLTTECYNTFAILLQFSVSPSTHLFLTLTQSLLAGKICIAFGCRAESEHRGQLSKKTAMRVLLMIVFTYGFHPLDSTAGLSVLDIMEQEISLLMPHKG
ncbi:MAG: hypothetical protein ACSLEM_06320 [Candidatus Malihini olakiniferum]